LCIFVERQGTSQYAKDGLEKKKKKNWETTTEPWPEIFLTEYRPSLDNEPFNCATAFPMFFDN
jgi:hypothetical protein